ncbi:hypothetical protein [Nocardioides sp. AE5]|uniref:hypothetical protein n=1 Tax=Nocardioides sp. AE5 TaxID=2962573 RepID=UPI00288240CD|nr:hypothetical protein [Nocardioides sp. AE5]MDT0200813.1 hypothetical protein [Nocardioides sp. AE5]
MRNRPYAAWAAALDQLEANVDELALWLETLGPHAAAEEVPEMAPPALLSGPWTVPDLPGPIPVEMVPRAQSIAVRQAAVRAALEGQRDHVRDHLRLARKVDGATGRPSRAAYLDLQA